MTAWRTRSTSARIGSSAVAVIASCHPKIGQSSSPTGQPGALARTSRKQLGHSCSSARFGCSRSPVSPRSSGSSSSSSSSSSSDVTSRSLRIRSRSASTSSGDSSSSSSSSSSSPVRRLVRVLVLFLVLFSVDGLGVLVLVLEAERTGLLLVVELLGVGLVLDLFGTVLIELVELLGVHLVVVSWHACSLAPVLVGRPASPGGFAGGA